MYQPPKPKGPQPQPQPKGPQPLAPQPKPEQKAQPQQWQTTFTGTLGKNTITMTLQRNGEMITGSYSYQGRQGALALGGYVSENGVTLNMDEQDSKGVKTGHLTLHIRENGVHGMWYPPTGAGTCYGVNLKPQVTPPQPKSNEPQPKPSGPQPQPSNAKPPTPPPVPPKPAQAANLTGSIGKYGIRMTLRVQEGKLSGNYGYISKGTTPFVLTGTVDAKGQATFMAGQETFTGTLSQDLKTFKGTWTAGGQTLECSVSDVKTDGTLNDQAQKLLASLVDSLMKIDFLQAEKNKKYINDNLPLILKMGIQDKIENYNQMAYILATAYHESKFGTPRYPRSVPLEEDSNPMRRDKNGLYRINHVTGRRINGGSLIAYFNDAYGNNKKLGNRRGTNDGYDFRGRGFVQLTGRSNYAKLSARLNEIGYNYTINGKTYGTRENPIDLLTNPDHVSRVPELSSIILVEGMKSGLYTGVGLDNFISSKSTDFFGARSIVNGDKNKIEQGNSRSNGQIIKGYADSFSIVLAKAWPYIIEVNKVGGGL